MARDPLDVGEDHLAVDISFPRAPLTKARPGFEPEGESDQPGVRLPREQDIAGPSTPTDGLVLGRVFPSLLLWELRRPADSLTQTDVSSRLDDSMVPCVDRAATGRTA